MNSKYVVFSMDALRSMFNTIWSNVGAIVSVALYTFVMVLGIYVIIKIVNSLLFGR